VFQDIKKKKTKCRPYLLDIAAAEWRDVISPVRSAPDFFAHAHAANPET
jgi:hypothetical protein